MAWDDDKSAGDTILSADWDAMVADQKTRAAITSGSGAPSSTPTMIGAFYIDTTNRRTYIAHGTSSSADWHEIPTT